MDFEKLILNTANNITTTYKAGMDESYKDDKRQDQIEINEAYKEARRKDYGEGPESESELD